MSALFYAACALWVVVFGKVRQYYLDANKSAQTAKILYDDTHTIYLDGVPYCDPAAIRSLCEGLDNEPVLSGLRNSGRA